MIIYLLLYVCSVHGALYYDSYRGTQISDEEYRRHIKANTTFWCVSETEPCDPYEARRIDGSCNNLNEPVRGMSHTPFTRMLPAVYDTGFDPKRSKSGNPLPLPRLVRTSILSEGKVPSQKFTQLAVNALVFMSADVVSLHDTVKYILWKPYCCEEKGKTDRDCVPNKIPEDDPVHRFSGIRCMNLTRPESFQSVGCRKNDTTPERIVSSTPSIDLSIIYGNSLKSLQEKGRLFEKGLLKYEIENGRVWPPSTKTKVNLCLLNAKPSETRCHNTPEDGTNTLMNINIMAIWFWRFHNAVARSLSLINPCWSDEKLFIITREINIAVALQIYYYELFPLLMGRNNLIRQGVISPDLGFRNVYNPKAIPQLSLEFPFVLRWVHKMQEGSLKMYDREGYYLKEYPIVNLTLRTGFLAVDNNLDGMTQGSFRQASAKINDYVVDPDIAELVLGPHQRMSDVFSNDLAKNRLFGFQPYIKYRELCFKKPIRSFDDLRDIVDPERIEILKERYESVEDIDLIVGLWVERPITGGYVPSTFYCIIVDQLIRNMVSDRHWYEKPNRPNAFSLPQLLEIRKASMARVLCTVGDTVTKIQPQAFLRDGPYNPILDCDKIEQINLWQWYDPACRPGQ